MIKSHKIIENNKIMSKRKKKKQLQTQFINTELRKLHKKKSYANLNNSKKQHKNTQMYVIYQLFQTTNHICVVVVGILASSVVDR